MKHSSRLEVKCGINDNFHVPILELEAYEQSEKIVGS